MIMRELESFGLIERKRQGQGKPAKIYVKNFPASEMADCTYSETAQKDTADRNQKSSFSSAKKEAVKTARSGQLMILRRQKPSLVKPIVSSPAPSKTALHFVRLRRTSIPLRFLRLSPLEPLRWFERGPQQVYDG